MHREYENTDKQLTAQLDSIEANKFCVACVRVQFYMYYNNNKNVARF